MSGGQNHLEAILARYDFDRSHLIGILQDVQAKERYLPREALEYIAQRLNIPETEVYRLATFFTAFSLKPRGRHTCQVCMGTACHVRGAERLLETIKRELKVESGETTEDMRFTLETVNCLGACALGPIVVVDGEYHGQMSSSKLPRILKQYE
jgi:NADH-quinone oxidoreductase subunit E